MVPTNLLVHEQKRHIGSTQFQSAHHNKLSHFLPSWWLIILNLDLMMEHLTEHFEAPVLAGRQPRTLTPMLVMPIIQPGRWLVA